LGYFASLYISSWVLGCLGRYIIKKYKLDVRYSLFRIESPWYYLFKAYENLTVIITASLVQGEICYLYSGYLEDFFFNRETGNIEYLILSDVKRRNIINDKNVIVNESAEDKNSRFYGVDGDGFILFCNDLKTLNVKFLEIMPEKMMENKTMRVNRAESC
jgi:hypothetical protein